MHGLLVGRLWKPTRTSVSVSWLLASQARQSAGVGKKIGCIGIREHRVVAEVSIVLEIRDGRTLRVHQAGDPGGPMILYHHGTPMNGALFDAWAADAAHRGARMV